MARAEAAAKVWGGWRAGAGDPWGGGLGWAEFRWRPRPPFGRNTSFVPHHAGYDVTCEYLCDFDCHEVIGNMWANFAEIWGDGRSLTKRLKFIRIIHFYIKN